MRWAMVTTLGLMVAGCAIAPLERSGSLASYDRLTPSDGLLTKSQIRVSRSDVLAARSVRIEPTAFAASVAKEPFTDHQRGLITNAVNRALCIALSERFEVVAPMEKADLSVRAVITHIAPTDPVAAGVSIIAGIVPSIVAPNVYTPPVPRLPIGLGSLSVEAEARARRGGQMAVMLWARGANSFTSSPRVSSDGDAYDLATSFADDFGQLLVTGESPFGRIPEPPSLDKFTAILGGAPKHPACEAFGRAPGLAGMIGEKIGMPPGWTDPGPPVLEPPQRVIIGPPPKRQAAR
jgi:uncharacterized protein DUF3313